MLELFFGQPSLQADLVFGYFASWTQVTIPPQACKVLFCCRFFTAEK